jgi:integrase/recombinase XerD
MSQYPETEDTTVSGERRQTMPAKKKDVWQGIPREVVNAVDNWRLHLKTTVSPYTKDRYLADLNLFCRKWDAEKGRKGGYVPDPTFTGLDCITTVRLREQLVEMMARGQADSTRKGRTVAVKVFAQYLCDERIWEPRVSPIKTVKVPGVKSKVQEVYTVEEVDAMLASKACNPKYKGGVRNRVIVLFLSHIGPRRSELLSLHNVDWKAETFSVKGKKGVRNNLPLDGEMIHALHRLCTDKRWGIGDPPKPPIFRSEKTGVGLSPSGLDQCLKRIALSAGVRVLGCHALRRHFAIEAKRKGMDIATIMKLGGWTKIEQLMEYLAPTAEKDAADTFKEVMNGGS